MKNKTRAPSSTPPIVHGLAIYDGKTEEIVDFLEIRLFDLAKFKQQFDVSEQNDPKMLDRYAVGPDDAAFVTREGDLDVAFDFAHTAYFIECLIKDT